MAPRRVACELLGGVVQQKKKKKSPLNCRDDGGREAHAGGGECLEAVHDVPVGDCGRALECGGGAEAGCPPPALHLALVLRCSARCQTWRQAWRNILALVVMDSRSISMDMVWHYGLEELAPFITNGDVEAAALCDAYGELWLAQRDEAIWFSGDYDAHKDCD
jgi:hypothetical protein